MWPPSRSSPMHELISPFIFHSGRKQFTKHLKLSRRREDWWSLLFSPTLACRSHLSWRPAGSLGRCPSGRDWGRMCAGWPGSCCRPRSRSRRREAGRCWSEWLSGGSKARGGSTAVPSERREEEEKTSGRRGLSSPPSAWCTPARWRSCRSAGWTELLLLLLDAGLKERGKTTVASWCGMFQHRVGLK